MTLISLEDAKAEVRKVVSDFKTRYDINYRLNNLPSIELEDEAEQTEPSRDCDTCRYDKEPWHRQVCNECTVGDSNYEPSTEGGQQ